MVGEKASCAFHQVEHRSIKLTMFKQTEIPRKHNLGVKSLFKEEVPLETSIYYVMVNQIPNRHSETKLQADV